MRRLIMRNRNMKELFVNIKKSLVVVTFLFLLIGCESSINEANAGSVSSIKSIGGLNIGTMKETRLDSIGVVNLIRQIKDDKYGEIHSILISRHNKLVVEEYFPGYECDWLIESHKGEYVKWGPDDMHGAMSTTKSITS